MSYFVVKAFTNELGQVIEPGDVVLYVGKSGDRIVTKQGNFEGVYYNDVTSWDHGRLDEVGRATRVTTRTVTGVRVGGIPSRRWIWNRETRKGHYEDAIRKAILPKKRVYRLVQNG